jgi:hypothetical protein
LLHEMPVTDIITIRNTSLFIFTFLKLLIVE